MIFIFKSFSLFVMHVLFVFLLSLSSLGNYLDEMSIGLGFSNISYEESEPQLDGPNIKPPASGTVSVLVVNGYYKFFSNSKISLYTDFSFPLFSLGENSSYYSIGAGLEYYFSKENNVVRIKNEQYDLSIDPKLRYFAKASLTPGYMTYNTETEIKNDFHLELGLGGGVIYSLKDDYGLKGDLTIGKGLGSLTSTLNIRLHFSYIYYL